MGVKSSPKFGLSLNRIGIPIVLVLFLHPILYVKYMYIVHIDGSLSFFRPPLVCRGIPIGPQGKYPKCFSLSASYLSSTQFIPLTLFERFYSQEQVIVYLTFQVS